MMTAASTAPIAARTAGFGVREVAVSAVAVILLPPGCAAVAFAAYAGRAGLQRAVSTRSRPGGTGRDDIPSKGAADVSASTAGARRVGPLLLNGVAGDRLRRPRADVADLAVDVVVPARA